MENIDKFESDLNKITLAKYLMKIDFADANSKINELIVYLKTNKNSAFFTVGYKSIVFYKLNIPYGFQDASRRQGRESPGA